MNEIKIDKECIKLIEMGLVKIYKVECDEENTEQFNFDIDDDKVNVIDNEGIILLKLK